MKGKFKNRVPRLTTLNLELRDFNFYIEEKEIDSKRLDLDIDFGFKNKDKSLELFIHIQYLYLENPKAKKDDEKNYIPLYHSDHLIKFEVLKSQKETKSLDPEMLADHLGRSIIMIKGYFDNITKGFQINDFPLPRFNPLEMIKVKYENDFKNGKIPLKVLS